MNLHPRLHTQLAALLVPLVPHLTWKHHGIGVLQAYVRENDEPEVRVHIWHPELVREGIEECGDAHDHRFDLESTVIVGGLRETVYQTPMFGDGARIRHFDIWHVENARSAADRSFDGECTLSEQGTPRVAHHLTHRAGSTYSLPRGFFHRTQVSGLAVTLCTMREKRGQARILVPTGKEPVHAFGGERVSNELRSSILAEAIETLNMAARPSF